MKKIKLLMPLVGLATVAAAAAPMVACGTKSKGGETKTEITQAKFDEIMTNLGNKINQTHDSFYRDEIKVTETEDGTTTERNVTYVGEGLTRQGARKLKVYVGNSTSNSDQDLDANSIFLDIQQFREPSILKEGKYYQTNDRVKAHLTLNDTSKNGEQAFAEWEISNDGFLLKHISSGLHANADKREMAIQYLVKPHDVKKFDVDKDSLKETSQGSGEYRVILDNYLTPTHTGGYDVNITSDQPYARFAVINEGTSPEACVPLDGTILKIYDSTTSLEYADWTYNSGTFSGNALKVGGKYHFNFKLANEAEAGLYKITFGLA